MPTIEEIKAKPETERTAEEKSALAAAERTTDKSTEHMIPKSRLDEVIAERETARAEALKLKTEQDKAKADALKEQGKWQELAEQRQKDLDVATGKAAKVDEYEKTLQDTLKAQLEELPAELRGLVPEELTTPQKLGWLSKNKATLLKPVAGDIGAGRRGGSGSSNTKVELSAEQIQVAKSFGYTPEEYAHFTAPSAEPFKQSDK